MKKRNCRMTVQEKAVHDFAVRVRKMTDQQLYDFVNQDTKSKTENGISEFLEYLENSGIHGIGPKTVRKIKAFAVNEGYISE